MRRGGPIVACCGLAWCAASAVCAGPLWSERTLEAVAPGGEAVTFSVRVGPTEVTTAGEVAVEVSAEGAGVLAVSVDAAATLDWEAYAGPPAAGGDAGGGGGAAASLRLEPMLAGELETPVLTLSAAGGFGEVVAEVEPIAVMVGSVLGAETGVDLAAARPLFDPAPVPAWRWWAAGVAGAAAVLVGAAVWRRWRRRDVSAPKPAAHEAALAELDALLASGLLERQAFVAFTGEVSGVLRRYVESRFGLSAPDLTTEEFLRLAEGSARVPRDEVPALASYLGHVDLVKFAKMPVTEAACVDGAATVRGFVERTAAGRAA